jgi:hypothetical protein
MCGYFIVRFIWVVIEPTNKEKEISDMKLCEEVLEWCLELYPIRKTRPNLILNTGKSKYMGAYSFGTNTITIYIRQHVSQNSIIDTTIHEYFHFYLITSDTKNMIYKNQLDKYGVWEHPQEILCETMAKELTKRFLKRKNNRLDFKY